MLYQVQHRGENIARLNAFEGWQCSVGLLGPCVSKEFPKSMRTETRQWIPHSVAVNPARFAGGGHPLPEQTKSLRLVRPADTDSNLRTLVVWMRRHSLD